jgi:hypothetical protein
VFFFFFFFFCPSLGRISNKPLQQFYAALNEIMNMQQGDLQRLLDHAVLHHSGSVQLQPSVRVLCVKVERAVWVCI